MIKIILLIVIVEIIKCLETKFLKKLEYFEKDCSGSPFKISIKKLKHDCTDKY